MGENARSRQRKRLLFEWAMPFDETVENGEIKLWSALGRRKGRIYFPLSRPNQNQLRRLAHAVALANVDRTFRYGYDEENAPFIEVL